MGTYTVWYQIDDKEAYPHADSPLVFVTDLTPVVAERVAAALVSELKWLIGDDLPIKAWVE